jgi:hypothetical protein
MVQIPNAPRLGDMPKGDPVPEGNYHLRLDKASFKETGKNSKAPGTPMAECEFTIFGPAEAEEFHGRKVFENLMLSGEGLFRTRNLLEAAGLGDDFLLEDTDQLLKLEVGAVVQIEPERPDPKDPTKKYQARNKVKKFVPIG